MKITHKKNSIILTPDNPSQTFMLGRLFQKFPNLGWLILYDINENGPNFVSLELKDESLDKLFIDCLDGFKNE